MNGDLPLKFGTLEIAMADVIADAKLLHVKFGDGVLNKHELGMLIQFLQAKRDALDPP